MEASNVQEVWRLCMDGIAPHLSEAPASRAWLQDTHPVSLSEDTLTLRVPNLFTKDWIESRLGAALHDVLVEVYGRDMSVEILTGGNPTPAQTQNQIGPPGMDGMELQGPAESLLSSKYTFDSFVMGSGNQLAHAAALAVAEAPATAYNPLFIYGAAGLGKTHLLHAIGNQAHVIYPHLRIKYVSTETFTNDFINAIRHDGSEAFKRRYRGESDVLLVDDIQFIENKESTQEEFFHTFNALHSAGKQIVISSDRLPRNIPTLEDRLRSRFEWGLITDIQFPDLETRIAILRMWVPKYKTGTQQIGVPEEVLTYIASRVESNVRELEGALIRVIAFASLSHVPVSLSLAEEVLATLFPGGDEPVRVDTILAETAAFFGLTVDELRSHNRTRALNSARQIAMYLVRDLTDYSLPKIGSEFGGRDHTTVLHAQKNVRKQLSENRVVYQQIQELTNRIRKRSGR